jgi:UDP-N-acetylglucosamine--N-acetylmuramyl-(pentapeptide) pyrophosphoryl-undecaprenol N-acetylglucosamine transferase
MLNKILIITGGTGGHIFPAVALAQQIHREIPNSQVLFAGGNLDNNRYFDRNAFAWHAVPCGAFVKKTPLALIKSLSNICSGIRQSLTLIREFRPDVAVGFGSFYSFPPLIAAKLMSVPLILHEANSIPGKVNRLLSKYAAASTVHFPQTLKLLKGNTIEVGMPLREELISSRISKQEAKQHYGLNANIPVILIFGGSQGARIINTIVCDAIKSIDTHLVSHYLHTQPALQVIHLTGSQDSISRLQSAYAEFKVPSVVKSFEPDMKKAWLAADMVISRAGAGTIAEQLEFEVPGILIPFAGAADNHQEHNADFMVKNVGGAKKLLEKELNTNILAAEAIDLLKEKTLSAMRNAMHNYKQKSRTRDLCSIVKEVIGYKN